MATWTRPSVSAARPWSLPKVDRDELPNGLVVKAVHLAGRPVVEVRVHLKAGAAAEDRGRAGITSLMIEGLREGSVERDHAAISTILERHGAALATEVNWDSSSVSLSVPAHHLAAGLRLLGEVVTRPSFRKDRIDRQIVRRVEHLLHDQADPTKRASSLFLAGAFGPSSREALPIEGTVETMRSLDATALLAHHKTFGPQRAEVIVAGDLGGIDAQAIVAETFGTWTAPGREHVRIAAARGPGGVLLVDRPGSVQSAVHLGHHGPGRAEPDHAATRLVETALSGTSNSRIYYKLREEKGYTYGALGGFDYRRSGGVYQLPFAVQTDNTVDAILDAVTELRNVQQGGLTTTELDFTSQLRAGLLPIQMERTSALVEALGVLVTHDLAADSHEQLRASYLSTTLEELHAAAATWLQPDALTVAVVGDAARIHDRLAREVGIVYLVGEIG